jgi:preprotein translocase subunit SecG
MVFFWIFLVLFLFVCLGLVFLIIIQSDKGGGISGAIGGGLSGANTLLGTQDAGNILTKGTTGFAIAYMVLCIVLSLFLSKSAMKEPVSALQKRAETQQQGPTASEVLQGGGLPLGEAAPAAQAPAQQNAAPAPDANGAMPLQQGAAQLPAGGK